MSKRRAGRSQVAREATLSLAQAAAQLGIDVSTLLEAIEDSGIETPRAGQEFRLEAAEIEKYRRLVVKGRSQSQESLARLREDLGTPPRLE